MPQPYPLVSRYLGLEAVWEAWNFCPYRGEGWGIVNTGGLHCLFGETLGVNVQHGIDRIRPSGPGTVRVWNLQPYEGEKLVYADPQRRVTVAVRLNWDPGLILITVGYLPIRSCTYVQRSLSVCFWEIKENQPVVPTNDQPSLRAGTSIEN